MARIAYDVHEVAAFRAARHVPRHGVHRLVRSGRHRRRTVGVDTRTSYPRAVGGNASAIPLRDVTVDAAWLSTMVHRAATETGRVIDSRDLLVLR